jgi:hypothetical protein
LDPTIGHGGVSIDMLASGAFLLVILEVIALPQDDTHFENHFWLHNASEFTRIDSLVIFRIYHFIVTPFHAVISVAILAIPFDNIIKTLRICAHQ